MTFGTWVVERRGRKLRIVENELRHEIARIGGALKNPEDCAHLIACAPHLLAACRAAYDLLTGDGQDGTMGHHKDNPVPAMLRAAMARAEGKT